MKLKRMLRLIKKARELDPPPRAPRPKKRIKLGKGFDVCCKKSADSDEKRYFIRKRSKKTGKRYPVCMTTSWESMMEHMGWEVPEDEENS